MMKKHIKFSVPSKTEFVIIAVILITLFFMDVSQNKVLDLGLNYRTTWFGSNTTLAINNFWFGFFVYVILYTILLSMNLGIRETHKYWNILFGVVAFTGLAFLVGGFVGEYANLTGIPFFSHLLDPTDFYHVGIAMSLISGLLFAGTD